MSWTISPGHFGSGTGASGIIDEVTEAIKVSKRVTEILRSKYGIKVNYLEDNVSKSRKENIPWLVNKHNATTRDNDMSIHFNAITKPHNKGVGTEILIVNKSIESKAAGIVKSVADVSGLINRGVQFRNDLGFLKGTDKHAYLMEVCFVNDSVDVALYRRDFEKICQAMAKQMAIISGFKLTEGNSVNKESTNVSNAKKNIKWAVKQGYFKDPHNDLDNYTEEQLIRYQNALIERLK